MRKDRRLADIDDLLLRLNRVQAELPSDDIENEQKTSRILSSSDEFLDLKTQFLDKCQNLQGELKRGKSLATTRTRDRVQANQKVRAELKDLGRILSEMEALYAKQARKKRPKFSKEEMNIRGDFISEFKANLLHLKHITGIYFAGLDNDGGQGKTLEAEASFVVNQSTGLNTAGYMKDLPTASVVTSPDSGIELSPMQKQGLEQVRLRDEEFDEVLDQIGAAIERAGEQAKLIGDKAELHRKMIGNVELGVEKAQEKLTSTNMRMKTTMESKGFAFDRFCTTCICCVVFLAILGLVINLVF